MEALKRVSRPYPVITQIENNTTLWIGHLQSDPTDHFAGQTFTCPASGDLSNIQVYSAVVHNPGQIMLSLHAFDEETKSWGLFWPVAQPKLKRMTKMPGSDLRCRRCPYINMQLTAFDSTRIKR